MNYKVIWLLRAGGVKNRSFRHLDRAYAFFSHLRKDRQVAEAILYKITLQGPVRLHLWNRIDWNTK